MTSCHSDFLEAKLLESIRNETEHSINTAFEIIEQDASGRVIGGVDASVSYGWLLIKILWVDKAHRKTGIGSKLVSSAESKALDIGCHSAWLDTSNPKAMAFYAKLGYTSFGKLENTPKQKPPMHCRWFMKKELTGPC